MRRSRRGFLKAVGGMFGATIGALSLRREAEGSERGAPPPEPITPEAESSPQDESTATFRINGELVVVGSYIKLGERWFLVKSVDPLELDCGDWLVSHNGEERWHSGWSYATEKHWPSPPETTVTWTYLPDTSSTSNSFYVNSSDTTGMAWGFGPEQEQQARDTLMIGYNSKGRGVRGDLSARHGVKIEKV